MSDDQMVDRPPDQRWTYGCKMARVVDGDTIDLDVDLGFRIGLRIRVRLLDIDTPEIRGPERAQGLEAKAFVEDWFFGAEETVVQTHKTGKYGRWLANLWRKVDAGWEPFSLVEALKTAGHGDDDE